MFIPFLHLQPQELWLEDFDPLSMGQEDAFQFEVGDDIDGIYFSFF